MQEISVSSEKDIIRAFNAINPLDIIMVEIDANNECHWLGMVIKYGDNFVLSETSVSVHNQHLCYDTKINVTIADLLYYINKSNCNDYSNRQCKFYLLKNLLELRDFLVEKTNGITFKA